MIAVGALGEEPKIVMYFQCFLSTMVHPVSMPPEYQLLPGILYTD